MIKKELRLAKRILRDTRNGVRENIEQIYQPYQAFLQSALRRECLDPDYFFYTWPEKKVVYIELPKCASSFVLTVLSKARNGIGFDPRNPHHQINARLPGLKELGAKAFFDLTTDPDTFIFTVVRNPFSRAVSGYIDKFSRVKIGDGSYISDVVTNWWVHKGREVPIGRPITFAEFCTLAQETAHIGFDGHWVVQSRVIPTETLAPHRICRFETLIDDLASVLQHVGASGEIRDHVQQARRSRPSFRLGDYITEDLRESLATTYREDFVRFGYDPTDIADADSVAGAGIRRHLRLVS